MDDIFPHAERSPRAEFIRELVERLYDGCSVTFTVPHHPGIDGVANEMLSELREYRGCLTAYLDLSSIKSVEEFADALIHAYLELITGDIESLESTNDSVHMNAWEKVDWLVELSERLATSLDTRLVVWFDEWQEIARIDGGGDLLLKRLRGMFQLQTHVTYAFTGSRDPDLLRKLFAEGDQAFYRFAVEMQLE